MDATASTGIANADPFALNLPTTSVVPLADGLTLGLSTPAQVTQPPNGSGGFPCLLPDGSTPDLLIPVDASGNQVRSETLTPGGIVDVPEPASPAMLLAGVVAMAAARRRA